MSAKTQRFCDFCYKEEKMEVGKRVFCYVFCHPTIAFDYSLDACPSCQDTLTVKEVSEKIQEKIFREGLSF